MIQHFSENKFQRHQKFYNTFINLGIPFSFEADGKILSVCFSIHKSFSGK